MKLLPILVTAGAAAFALSMLIDRDGDDDPAPAAPPIVATQVAVATPPRAAAPPIARIATQSSPAPIAEVAAPAPPLDPDDPRWARNDPHLDFFTSEIRDSGAPDGDW